MYFSWRSYKWFAVVVGFVVILTCGIVYYFLTRGEVSTDDAFVDGHIFIITPRVSDYLTKVLVTDNQIVTKGQPLITLDPTPYEVALAQAKASLAQSRFTLTSLELGVPLQLTQTAEQVKGAKAELESLRKTLEQLLQDEVAASQEVKRLEAQSKLATVDLERNTALRKSGAISQQALDNAETSYRSALAQLQGARARLESVKKQRAAQEADIQLREANVALAATGKEQAEIKARQTEAQKAKVKLAEAQVKRAELDLSYTTIVSPTDGYVTQKKIEPGQYVSPGQQLFAVVPLNPPEVWITANYKETQLTDVHPGQPVQIEVDTYPGITIQGKVDSIMAGTGAVFSLFPPENATGNFVKVVQRIPVKITINKQAWDGLPTLRIGLSVIPTILTLDNNHGQARD
ncbi:MAG: HlyD family secretion protein [Desulfomonile tiedjei]|uniref:HlyD family secretion protein n=1 Tax=Desulfomonile tiedjei TaxID=2358 RepID=A0A9D6Z2B5_9BACT|nr:HlyD family secretion protein [Desulfomonile tiedjei]